MMHIFLYLMSVKYGFILDIVDWTLIVIFEEMSEEKETVFNNIRSFVQQKVNSVISSHLTNKNYNVNDAQIWTNQICDDVPYFSFRFSRKSPPSTRTSSSSPTASSCRKLTVDSTFPVHVSGTTRSTEQSPSSGMLLPSSASSTSSAALSDSHNHHPNTSIISNCHLTQHNQ